MQTSPLWDEIRAGGRAEETQAMILRQGRRKFGEALSREQQAHEAVTDLEQLRTLGERLLGAGSWAGLNGPNEAMTTGRADRTLNDHVYRPVCRTVLDRLLPQVRR